MPRTWFSLLPEEGEVAGLIRNYPWETNALGGPETWPQPLRTLLALMLESQQPMFVAWGPERIMLYNDAYATILGARHPAALGARFYDVWADIREDVGPILERAFAGQSTHVDSLKLIMHRNGYAEETYFAFSYNPVRDESGVVAGMFCGCREITEQVLAERRRQAQAERLRALFDHAPSFVAATRGPEHVFEFANAAYVRLIGDRDPVGLSVQDALPEVAGQGFFELLDRVYATGEPFIGLQQSVILRRASGDAAEERFVDFVYQPIRDETGAVTGIFVEGSDVTERMRAEQAVRESDAFRRLLLDSTEEAFYSVDTRGVTTLCNAAFLRMLGFGSEDEAVGRALHDVIHHSHPDGRPYPRDHCPIYRTAQTGEPAHVDDEVFFRRDGTSVPVEYRVHPIWRDGALAGAICTFADITERKRTEAALREESRLLETLNETGAALAAELDLDRVVQTVTDAAVQLTGAQFGAFFYNVLNAAGESYMLYALSGVERARFDQFPMPRATAIFQPTFKGEGVLRSADILADPRYGHSDPHRGMPEGHLPVRSYLAVPVVSRSGEVIGGLFFGHERTGVFTERHERLIAGLAGQAAVAVDNARLFQAEQRLRNTLEAQVETRTRELVEAEEALRQAQKMEAVGQLTGGIAHDFNNLLQGILGSLNLVQKRIASGRMGEVDRFISGAVTSANRAAALTHRLLAFSRRQPLDPKPVRANQLVASMEDLLRRTLGEHIALELVLAGGLWQTLCDPNQLESALLNLAINARDAMPEGGKLTVETCNAHLDSLYAARQRDVKPGQYVCVCVTDTGTGMSPDVIERAFDPFFTTKPIGQGTGLGLSMIYGFARQSEGYAKIYSEVGQGTTVKLYLPRHRGEGAEDSDPETLPELTPAHQAEAGETVLVVEDEPVVRGLIVEVLHELGYEALEAADGPSGLELIRSKRRRIDLLVTDIGLPGLNGRQLADAARELRPALKVLFMTGYAENAALASGFLDHDMAMITKPFAMEQLATRIREMIEG